MAAPAKEKMAVADTKELHIISMGEPTRSKPGR